MRRQVSSGQTSRGGGSCALVETDLVLALKTVSPSSLWRPPCVIFILGHLSPGSHGGGRDPGVSPIRHGARRTHGPSLSFSGAKNPS